MHFMHGERQCISIRTNKIEPSYEFNRSPPILITSSWPLAMAYTSWVCILYSLSHFLWFVQKPANTFNGQPQRILFEGGHTNSMCTGVMCTCIFFLPSMHLLKTWVLKSMCVSTTSSWISKEAQRERGVYINMQWDPSSFLSSRFNLLPKVQAFEQREVYNKQQ